ncbi:hypothetical protein BB558_005350 [Smittium angustum]|uniref:RING-type domain-containing protein n=1 Tax=Smittium angustum TaxID=133377 RepID=A0A2U1J0Y7_SMIAN|nr:hypothetical protein BB558_005350 [Smittium angustum]
MQAQIHKDDKQNSCNVLYLVSPFIILAALMATIFYILLKVRTKHQPYNHQEFNHVVLSSVHQTSNEIGIHNINNVFASDGTNLYQDGVLLGTIEGLGNSRALIMNGSDGFIGQLVVIGEQDSDSENQKDEINHLTKNELEKYSIVKFSQVCNKLDSLEEYEEFTSGKNLSDDENCVLGKTDIKYPTINEHVKGISINLERNVKEMEQSSKCLLGKSEYKVKKTAPNNNLQQIITSNEPIEWLDGQNVSCCCGGKRPENSVECLICFEEISHLDEVRMIPCLHYYHVRCLDLWLLKSSVLCPACRFDLRIGRHK